MQSFFADKKSFPFEKKIVFSPGTAPMRYSEIDFIYTITKCNTLYLVDPRYKEKSPLMKDLKEIAQLAQRNVSQKFIENAHTQILKQEITSIQVTIEQQIRNILFIAKDASIPTNIPKNFNIFFSGRRVCPLPGENTATPNNIINEIVNILPEYGCFYPDRDTHDDSTYFSAHPSKLSLYEISGTRLSTKEHRAPKPLCAKEEKDYNAYRRACSRQIHEHDKKIRKEYNIKTTDKFFVDQTTKTEYTSIEELQKNVNTTDFKYIPKIGFYENGNCVIQENELPQNIRRHLTNKLDEIQTSLHKTYISPGVALYQKNK